MLYQPLESLTYTAWAMEGATAGARRCFEVLDRADDVVDAPDAQEISETAGGIGFQDVNFSYGSQPVLQDINLSISPNQIVALVGGTGAGKSTLLSLVPRFYDPNSGAVTLDGRDVRAITKRSLRSKIGIVLQDTLLFSTTIRENIAYGRSDATDDEIREAARRAQADEFISRLPAGYDSPSGRANVRARSYHRSCHHGNDQGSDARPHHSYRHASARDGSSRRSHRRARERRNR